MLQGGLDSGFLVSLPKSVILSEAKDLRRCLRLNCDLRVLTMTWVKTGRAHGRRIDLSEVLRFAQDDRANTVTELSE
jgi:hypothetical protein